MPCLACLVCLAMLSSRNAGDTQAASDELQKAVRALKRFKVAGHDVDPSDVATQVDYLSMRATCDRIDGHKFLAWVKNKKTSFNQNTEQQLRYWVVPKVNFPDGLPADLADAVVSPDDLAHAELTGGAQFDHEHNYIMDECAPRGKLKKKCRLLIISSGSQTQIDRTHLVDGHPSKGSIGQPPAAGQPQAAQVSQPQAAQAAQPAAAQEEPPKQLDAIRQEAIPRQISTNRFAKHKTLHQSNSDPSDIEEPVHKRRRQLSETLKGLREGITASANEGNWFSDSEWCQDSVCFLIHELMHVLEGIIDNERKAATGAGTAATGAVAPVVKLANKVSEFLAELFKGCPMFDSVNHFQGVFTKLKALGAEERGDGLLIEALASLPLPLGNAKMLDMSNADVVERNEFRSTPLWISYCERAFFGRLEECTGEV